MQGARYVRTYARFAMEYEAILCQLSSENKNLGPPVQHDGPTNVSRAQINKDVVKFQKWVANLGTWGTTSSGPDQI